MEEREGVGVMGEKEHESMEQGEVSGAEEVDRMEKDAG